MVASLWLDSAILLVLLYGLVSLTLIHEERSKL
jgi:hypothetical protein